MAQDQSNLRRTQPKEELNGFAVLVSEFDVIFLRDFHAYFCFSIFTLTLSCDKPWNITSERAHLQEIVSNWGGTFTNSMSLGRQ